MHIKARANVSTPDCFSKSKQFEEQEAPVRSEPALTRLEKFL